MTQDEYLAILFNDDRKQRNAYLTRLFKREIASTDELVPAEKHSVIDCLKRRRQDEMHKDTNEEEDDE